MANNYLQFSEIIDHLTTDEEAWLCRQMDHIYVFGDHEYSEGSMPTDLDPDDADWDGIRAWRNQEDIEFPDEMGFGYQFDDDGSDGRLLWIYGEEYGEVERVAGLVQQFLRHFRPDRCWSLTYSWTCSKLRVGEFGGGAVFITADAMKWQDADNFIAEEEQAFASHHGQPRL